MRIFAIFFLFIGISLGAVVYPPGTGTSSSATNAIGNNSGFGTNATIRGLTVTADANGTNMVRTMTATLRTNQDFVVNDLYGNDLWSIRRSRYNSGTNSEYFFHLGSVGSPIVDMQIDLATGGADWIWTINGNLNDAFRLNTDTGILSLQYGNPTYHAEGADNQTLFDNKGKVYPVRLQSAYAADLTTAAVGVAAGSGATVTGDGNTGTGKDVACSLTLATGTGTTAGIVLTYTFSTTPGAFASPPVVVVSGGNAAGCQSLGAIYATATTTVMTVTAVAGLDTSTVHTWNFHIIQ